RIFPIGAVTVCASSANRTPQLGQRSASAGTEVLQTGHSYSVASPSENSAPQPGHTVASAETSVSQTGQRNCSPRSATASVAGLGLASAPPSADSGDSAATFLSLTKISRWSSLPPCDAYPARPWRFAVQSTVWTK